MSKKLLWKPAILETGLTKYINFLKKNDLHQFKNYINYLLKLLPVFKMRH